MQKIHNYADDNAIQHEASSLDDLIRVLENESNTAVDWISLNEMVVNPKKFQLLISVKSNTKRFIGTPINIKGKTIYSTDSIKFLGINIDNEFKFNEHIGSVSIHHRNLHLVGIAKSITYPDGKDILIEKYEI